jgi:signal transduction histidine kinase
VLTTTEIPSNILLSLDCDQLGGIVEILKMIAISVDACGCVLWKIEPFADLRTSPPTGNLYAFAGWFDDDLEIRLHKLPINKSANGMSIISEQPINIPSLEHHPDTVKHAYSIQEAKLTSMYVLPLRFRDDRGIDASLSVYRRFEINPFDQKEENIIGSVAKLLPQLYGAICDKVALALLGRVNIVLDEIGQELISEEAEDRITPTGKVNAISFEDSVERAFNKLEEGLGRICSDIGDTFQCVETSLFFENRFNQKEVFKRIGTNYSAWSSEKSEYRLNKEDGLTAWPLVEKKPVILFNLLTFSNDQSKLQRDYPGIRWSDSLNFNSPRFLKDMRGILDLPQESDLPPLSFMAAPILRGNRLLGVLRCCGAKKIHNFFLHEHLELLEIIAVPIGRFLNDFLIHLDEKKEANTWKVLVKEINELNDNVESKLDSGDFDEKQVYDSILRLALKTFEAADVFDIRLVDKSSRDTLYFETFTHRLGKFKYSELKKRFERTFARNDKESDNVIAFEVIKTGEVALKNIDCSGVRPPTFPEAREIIVAPIGVEDNNFGVLDIWRMGDRQFQPYDTAMAALIGRQLGLYISLMEIDKQKTQVFEDTWHQLKSPIRHTFARATRLLDMIDTRAKISDSFLELELQALRGVTRKASSVLDNAGIFAELAAKGHLKSPREVKQLEFDALIRMLSAVYKDARLLIRSTRNITFSLDRQSFKKLDQCRVEIDFDYLQQALNSLVDNAAKYSYEDTVIRIYGGQDIIDQNKYFYVAVENEGIEIDPQDISNVVKRNWRGEYAKLTTGEGSGIGLWVTDHIMKAHNGSLVIIPTTSRGYTTAKLLFPILD